MGIFLILGAVTLKQMTKGNRGISFSEGKSGNISHALLGWLHLILADCNLTLAMHGTLASFQEDDFPKPCTVICSSCVTQQSFTLSVPQFTHL